LPVALAASAQMAGGVQPEATYIFTHICSAAAIAIAKKTLQIKLGLPAACWCTRCVTQVCSSESAHYDTTSTPMLRHVDTILRHSGQATAYRG
jgi:hypothetical protein